MAFFFGLLNTMNFNKIWCKINHNVNGDTLVRGMDVDEARGIVRRANTSSHCRSAT